MSDNQISQWHLSKSVPITFILAIILQTFSLVWYVSNLDNAVSNNTKDLIRQETRLESLEKMVQQQSLTLVRMDENIKAIRNIMETPRR